MRGKKVCFMGCKLAKGQKVHQFPQDAERREKWCRILGVNPGKRRAYLCRAHFPYYFIQGNTLSRFTLPNPPGSREMVTEDNKIEEGISNISDDSQLVSAEKEDEEDQKSQETQENKIEDFEIRKGNNDMIIKGRFIQTDNYLMISYTPPKKWSLQKQVELLNDHCTRLLRQIQTTNNVNCLLRTQISKYEKLLPKLRYLQKYNRFIYAQLKMYKLKEKAAKKRRMETLKKQRKEESLKESSPDSQSK